MTQTLTIGKALENDPKVLIMGEDVGKLGGVFRVTDGLQKDFGEARVIDTPLAESGIVGTAIGLALRGYRPVFSTDAWTASKSIGDIDRRSRTSMDLPSSWAAAAASRQTFTIGP